LELAADNREVESGKGARCLPTSLVRSSRPKGGQHDIIKEEGCRDGRSGVVRRQRSSGSIAVGKPCTKGFAIISVSRGLKDLYSSGDHALPHRYPLSTWSLNITECEHGSARRLALETRVLAGRSIGGWRVGRWIVLHNIN
jgi:hypothetical protein